MAKIIEKIVQSKYPPKNTNVLWDDGENLKISRNGSFENVVSTVENTNINLGIEVTVDNTTGNPSANATIENDTIKLAFSGLKGETGPQGNSGYQGAAGELEVVNNLTDGGESAALSAEQGKVLKEEIAKLDDKIGSEATTRTYGAESYIGLAWNGSIPTYLSGFNGIAIPLTKGVSYAIEGSYQSVTFFSSMPQEGVSSNYLGSASRSFVATEEQKYLFVTLRLSSSTSINITSSSYGIIDEISNLNDNLEGVKSDIEDIKKDITIDSVLEPIDKDFGLIQNESSIFAKGKTSYPYRYAIYNVEAGSKYHVSCYSLNEQYIGARVGVAGTTTTLPILSTDSTSYNLAEVTIPNGYNRLYLNQSQAYPNAYSVVKIKDVVANNGVRIEKLEDKDNPVLPVYPSNKNKPVVAFVYDDIFEASFLKFFDDRGLKVTFAPIANINKSSWQSTGNALALATKNGHGTVAHGVVEGVSVTGSGISEMNDADAKTAIEGENSAFDDFNLSHRGLCEFNVWEDRPHTWAIVSKYYDYVVGFTPSGESPINIPSSSCLYQLNRYNTDSLSMLSSAKSYVDESINKGSCLLIFGGHSFRTSKGGSFSSQSDFLELLDYIKAKVDGGQLISLNLDDAVSYVWGKESIIKCHNFNYENPSLAQLKIDNGIKYCSSQGLPAKYSISISGTPTNGEFTLNIGGVSKSLDINTAQQITISTSSSDDIDAVISKILSKVYKAYTIRKEGNIIMAYRDIVGETFTPTITDNTSGLNFTIVKVQAGAEASWV